MTTISGPRSPVSIATTQSTSNASTARPAARAQSAATGYASGSSFHAATGAPSSVPRTLTDAKAQLDRFPAGADRDAVALVLAKAVPSDKELKAAGEALKRLADSAPEDMTPEDFKKLTDGVGYKEIQSGMMQMINSNLDKMIEEAKKRRDKKPEAW